MKVRTISRSEEAETRSSRREVLKVHRNTNPSLHPFEKAREVRDSIGTCACYVHAEDETVYIPCKCAAFQPEILTTVLVYGVFFVILLPLCSTRARCEP
jgi:hypothetical protein